MPSTNANAHPTSESNSAPAPQAMLRELTAALGKRLVQATQSPGPNEISLVNRKSEIVNPAPSETRVQTEPAPLNLQPPRDFSDIAVPALKSSNRNGKIARMPLEVREEVNELLRKGHTYKTIADTLEGLGYPDINAPNISAWKHGGYVDWLTEQQRAEQNLALPFALERCSRNAQLDRVQQNALVIATGRLTDILSHFNVKRALEVLYEKPQLLPSFIASLTSIGRCSSDLAKTFETVHNREQTIRDLLHINPLPASQANDAHSDNLENRSSEANDALVDSTSEQPGNVSTPARGDRVPADSIATSASPR